MPGTDTTMGAGGGVLDSTLIGVDIITHITGIITPTTPTTLTTRIVTIIPIGVTTGIRRGQQEAGSENGIRVSGIGHRKSDF